MKPDSRPGRRSDPFAPYVSDSRRRAPGSIRRVLVVAALLLVTAALVAAVVVQWAGVAAEGARIVASNPAPSVTIPTSRVSPSARSTKKSTSTRSPTPSSTPSR